MILTPGQNAAAEALFGGNPGLKIGPFLLGFFFDSLLVGIVVMMFLHWQAWSSARESTVIRILVYWLVIQTLAYTTYMIALNLRVLAFYYGDWAIFFDKTYVRWTYLFETFARTPVSFFFAARAYKLGGRSKLFIVFVAPLFLSSIAGAIWARVDYQKLYSASNGSMAPVYLWIASEVVLDIIITGYITYHLVTSRTGWKQTDKMITKLIILAIETQLSPTVVAIIFLIITIVNPRTSLAAFFAWLPNAYVISIFVVLNKRHALRREVEHESSNYRTRTKDTFGIRSKRGVETTGNIQIITETVRHIEEAAESEAADTDKGPSSPKGSLQVLHYNSSSQTRLTNPEK
ncbi:hypothetical protein DB88DRAFT_538595 [Papiliotrema laurentii]|uniref:DUF6534 domain-containing protein n=1 Tax=Papiliotrema laurentii TaxID=5418 RepID=A0AAD9FV33_PAPLA|nr:hypothetical protein DB88DRAFT_538595 [Papiliotrema laurentii]